MVCYPLPPAGRQQGTNQALAMTSPPARSDSFPFSSSLASLSRESFGARQLVRDGNNYDAFIPARRDEDFPNERIDLQVAKTTCGSAGLEQDEKESGTIFIVDSRSSVHVTGDFSILSSFMAIAAAAAPTYRTRDGRQLVVAGVGTISWSSFQLSDVLYVPGLLAGVALVSVTKLAERGYVVMFGGGQCHVRDQSTGHIVGNGRLHSQNGVYQLEFLKIPPDTTDTTAP